jgi:hypothetical protein
MTYDVTGAKHVGEYRIELEFEDGSRGVVELSRFLNRGGVFEGFHDMAFFCSFAVDRELGTLTWPGGVDIAPESLYAEATGRGLPSWMTPAEDLTPS